MLLENRVTTVLSPGRHVGSRPNPYRIGLAMNVISSPIKLPTMA